MEAFLVHVYIDKNQNETLIEKKKRQDFENTRERNTLKRQIQGDKAREIASQELSMDDVLIILKKKSKDIGNKVKSSTYKLLSDIEAAINLKGMLEEHVLNALVEFTLKEILKIIEKEFHYIIIESIK